MKIYTVPQANIRPDFSLIAHQQINGLGNLPNPLFFSEDA